MANWAVAPNVSPQRGGDLDKLSSSPLDDNVLRADVVVVVVFNVLFVTVVVVPSSLRLRAQAFFRRCSSTAVGIVIVKSTAATSNIVFNFTIYTSYFTHTWEYMYKQITQCTDRQSTREHV